MSNGTRIDPEEREPRAIKIKQPKHTGRKIVLAVLSVILVAAIGGGVFAFINYGDKFFEFDMIGAKTEETVSSESESSETSEEPAPEIPEEPESVPEESEPEPIITEEPEIPEESEPEVPEEPAEPEIPVNEWYMLLVNRSSPLPEDFSVETIAIDNEGHAVDSRIYEDLMNMITSGESAGLDFIFYTAYRSVSRQKELFEAGKTDAAPGTSEHNSGLAVDIGCAKGEFEGSNEEKWLLANAHEYGFILRYPEGKEYITGFAHEPWHFRYVGREQAKLIHESGLTLEEYLAQ